MPRADEEDGWYAMAAQNRSSDFRIVPEPVIEREQDVRGRAGYPAFVDILRGNECKTAFKENDLLFENRRGQVAPATCARHAVVQQHSGCAGQQSAQHGQSI